MTLLFFGGGLLFSRIISSNIMTALAEYLGMDFCVTSFRGREKANEVQTETERQHQQWSLKCGNEMKCYKDRPSRAPSNAIAFLSTNGSWGFQEYQPYSQDMFSTLMIFLGIQTTYAVFPIIFHFGTWGHHSHSNELSDYNIFTKTPMQIDPNLIFK